MFLQYLILKCFNNKTKCVLLLKHFNIMFLQYLILKLIYILFILTYNNICYILSLLYFIDCKITSAYSLMLKLPVLNLLFLWSQF
jgi:hypothetical protein